MKTIFSKEDLVSYIKEGIIRRNLLHPIYDSTELVRSLNCYFEKHEEKVEIMGYAGFNPEAESFSFWIEINNFEKNHSTNKKYHLLSGLQDLGFSKPQSKFLCFSKFLNLDLFSEFENTPLYNQNYDSANRRINITLRADLELNFLEFNVDCFSELTYHHQGNPYNDKKTSSKIINYKKMFSVKESMMDGDYLYIIDAMCRETSQAIISQLQIEIDKILKN